MNAFLYVRPASIEETVTLLSQHGRKASLLAGGTDLLVRMRHGRSTPQIVIDLKRVSGLSAEVIQMGDFLRVGALTRLSDLIENEHIRGYFPALVEAAGTVGSVQIRNRATLAGNICNASPAADTAPALLVYAAQVNIVGVMGKRSVPLREFFVGPGKTVLEQGEIVESIDLPLPVEKTGAAFTRLTRRRGVDLATVSVCCLVRASGSVSFAFGAVAPTPLLVSDSGGVLSDPASSGEAKERVLRELTTQASPITDLRGGREYRQAMLLVMCRRALQSAVNSLNQMG
jgi:CO/xanthine dehydrogenase FAD-binding subunit